MSHGRSELRAFRAGRSDVSIPGVFDPGVVGLIRLKSPFQNHSSFIFRLTIYGTPLVGNFCTRLESLDIIKKQQNPLGPNYHQHRKGRDMNFAAVYLDRS